MPSSSACADTQLFHFLRPTFSFVWFMMSEQEAGGRTFSIRIRVRWENRVEEAVEFIYINESYFVVLYSKRQSTPASPIEVHLVAMERFAPPPKAKTLNWWAKKCMRFDHCASKWCVAGAEGTPRLVSSSRRICVCQSVIRHNELHNTIRLRSRSILVTHPKIEFNSVHELFAWRALALTSVRFSTKQLIEKEKKQQHRNDCIQNSHNARIYILFVSDSWAVMRVSSITACFRSVIYSRELFLFRSVFCTHPPTIRRFRMPHSYFTLLFCFLSSPSLSFSLAPSLRIYFMMSDEHEQCRIITIIIKWNLYYYSYLSLTPPAIFIARRTDSTVHCYCYYCVSIEVAGTVPSDSVMVMYRSAISECLRTTEMPNVFIFMRNCLVFHSLRRWIYSAFLRIINL